MNFDLSALFSTMVGFLLLLTIHFATSQCTNGMCEKKSLSLKTDTRHDYFLDGYVFETWNFSIWEECFNMCLRKCQCLSFNFNEVNKTNNCKLNDANTRLASEPLKAKKGVIYYEPVRNYYDENRKSRQSCAEPFCQNNCCESLPCQNGGTCRGVCDVSKRRVNCTCPPGFTGHKCQIKLPPRSCKEVMAFNKEKNSGNYSIVDQQNISFPVYCDFVSEPGAAWTLIQSHSLQSNSAYKTKVFYLHDMPVNQDDPEWDNYRLSKSRMKSIQDVSTHWRATCNFQTDGVDYRDYWRVSLQQLNLLVAPSGPAAFCLTTEYVNVHGIQCSNCTVWFVYSQHYGLHLDSSSEKCDLRGGIYNEDNFGFYETTNPEFRCTSSDSSTTQFWLGSF